MLKLDDKTIEFLNKILSMERDFHYLLDDLCKTEEIRRGYRVVERIYGIDKGDCDKLRKQLKEVFDSYKKMKQVYG